MRLDTLKLRYPEDFCLVIGMLVVVYRSEISVWMPRGAVVRAMLALEHEQ